MSLSPIEKAKRAAAHAASEAFIRSGLRIGVGSGSTVKYLVDYLKEQYGSGELKEILCIPTSFMTRKWLIDSNLPVSDLEKTPELDVCIDGADEVDPSLNCIKGGGGCLTQEKIVQNAAKKFVVIADSNKKAKFLGEKYKAVPIEILPFGYVATQRFIQQKVGGECEMRLGPKFFPTITDNGNYLVDWKFPESSVATDWAFINQQILSIPGVVETGLFLNVAETVYFATPEGEVDIVSKK
uniref:ribose-5-phosphate isomerase n=1 Tax=Acrobeloides nanus TaxID=290746 RepID=A0A914E6Z8_9BILA